MTVSILPYVEKLSGNYTKQVSFTTQLCKANNQYLRKIGVGLDNKSISYSLKYIGLTEAELLAIETLFSIQYIGDVIKFKSPLDLVDNVFRKPTTWTKDWYFKIENGISKVRVFDLSFDLLEGQCLTGIARIPPIVPPVQTFELTPAFLTVTEGGSLVVTITTTNVPDETPVTYHIINIDTTAGEALPANGTIILMSNSGTFTLTFPRDYLVESSETFQIELRNLLGDVLTTSAVITLLNNTIMLELLGESSPIVDTSGFNIPIVMEGSAGRTTDWSSSGTGALKFSRSTSDAMLINDTLDKLNVTNTYIFTTDIYITDYAANSGGYYVSAIISKQTAGSSNNTGKSYRFELSGTSTSFTRLNLFFYVGNTAYYLFYDQNFNLETKYTVGFTVNTTTKQVTLQIDGSTVATTSYTGNINTTSGSPYLGKSLLNVTPLLFTGYMDNLSITKLP
jgi:hypothetical protein